MTVDKETLGLVAAVLTGLAFVGRYSINHFRVLEIMRELFARLPLAIWDSMILDATDQHPLTTKRGSKRFSCGLFVRTEEFNGKFDLAMDRYRQASAYPLKSRVSLTALGLSLLTFAIMGVYFVGADRPSSSASAKAGPSVPAVAPSTTPTPNPTVAVPVAQPTKDEQWWKTVALGALTILATLLAFPAFLVVCFHFAVFGPLLEEFITLCETVGLVDTKRGPSGVLGMEIVPASADPNFKALLRVTKTKE